MTEFKPGDKLKLTKGDEVVTGEVNSFGGISTSLGTFSVGATFAVGNGWTIEVIKPKIELPTEHGVYRDKDGDVWVLGMTDALQLVAAGDGTFYEGDDYDGTLEPYSTSFFDGVAKENAPFTRLYTLEEAGATYWGKMTAIRGYDPYGADAQEWVRKVLLGES